MAVLGHIVLVLYFNTGEVPLYLLHDVKSNYNFGKRNTTLDTKAIWEKII